METTDPRNRPICILVLDGGIPGTTELSQLIIVKRTVLNFQHMVENRVDIHEDDELLPSDIFDFICGSGMGGVFAILFNIFQYSAHAAINFYLELHKRVFSTQAWIQKTRRENALLLKNAILELLPSDVLAQSFMTANESTGRMFICAANPKNYAHARLLRTYKSREDPPLYTVLDAILLSISDEDHLDPYPLGQFKELFTGSGHRNSNSTQYALREIPSSTLTHSCHA
ncbi:hypothetical protein DL96DRAFT_1250766 [Flagelloscypha sp. PMI_526]|nr:hypothetical protein DL96DRAFT_1250766 [Flagelloscypha sp. PMI_526]